MTVEDLFERYAQALSNRDVKDIATFWGIPSLVIGPKGSIAVAGSYQVEAFFAQSMDQYAAAASARANIVSSSELAPDIVGCHIAWDHLDAEGRTIDGEAGYYVLRRSSDAWTIEVYVPRPAQ